MFRARLAPIAAALLLIGSGCAPSVAPIDSPAPIATFPAPEVATAHWQQLGDGVARVEVSLHEASSGTMVLYRLSPLHFQFRLRTATLPQVVSRWSGTGATDRVVVNGMYFNEDFTPTGLIVKGGTRQGTRQFDFDKSGLLTFAPSFAIIDTKSTTVDPSTLVDAAQSYPFLIRDGANAIAEDSHQLARRTFVGQDRDGLVYLGVITTDEISLYGLMEVLQRTDIAWKHVLNLDGGTSTGLDAWLGDWQESRDSLAGVPSVLVAERTEKTPR